MTSILMQREDDIKLFIGKWKTTSIFGLMEDVLNVEDHLSFLIGNAGLANPVKIGKLLTGWW